ncbi:MAG: 4Fe-4S binding protein [Planctomycetaceae bacterium]|jgi:NAD-dependent dihydropyrimidine dehydrogenase PreA subunit|nr:4Fe-4S binding protein [Planctomycetaceae bacterium]
MPVKTDNTTILETDSVLTSTSLSQNAYVVVKKELCKACGLCIEFCPKKALFKGTNISEMGYEYTVYCGEGCIGCGTCFYVCPEPDALTVYKKKPSEK